MTGMVSFCGREDDEQVGISFVETSRIFARQDNFFLYGVAPLDRVCMFLLKEIPEITFDKQYDQTRRLQLCSTITKHDSKQSLLTAKYTVPQQLLISNRRHL